MIHSIFWDENHSRQTCNWVSQSHLSPPKKIEPADDTLRADDFYRGASEGRAFIWRGDFHNAKLLLQAVDRRIENRNSTKKIKDIKSSKDLFHLHRQGQAHRAQILSRLLIEIKPDLSIQLRRSPDVSAAITEAIQEQLDEAQTNDSGYGGNSFVISLRELLSFISAHEWRKKGVYVSALDSNIHPYYGVFSPVRGEYLKLVSDAPISKTVKTAYDIGTGTGVIAAILAKRGIKKIIATDTSDNALLCAQENIERLNFENHIELLKTNLFPPGKADLVICNPPWIPARPTSAIEFAVYDEDSKMLKAFLSGVQNHLSNSGEAWLIMSDLAEHLGLREKDEIKNMISQGGLRLIERLDTKAEHKKAQHSGDLLQQARALEITSLWRLQKA